MDFDKRKASTLASLSSNDIDKSPKGTLDTPIIPLLNALNSHPSYFTTSSCSGRISILSQPKPNPNSNNPTKKKARGGTWVFITHDIADPDSVISLLFADSTKLTPICELVFRFEPLIIAVECRDLNSAQNLVSLAISCGFRESGITSVSKRVIVGIRCSIRLEVPLGDTQKIMVSKDYVRFLLEVANEKMETNRKRSEGFLRAFLKAHDGALENANGSISSESGDCDEGQADLERSFGDNQDTVLGEKASFSCESLAGTGVPSCSLSISQMVIAGEPIERLFLWGHSACALENTDKAKVVVFGGFGGNGRHARRNDSFLLDPLHGTLKEINVVGCPSPRLGHTSSLIGDCMFVIGGRADPLNILSDVWLLNTVKNEWRLLDCTGRAFAPRHRHAAAVIGSKIYVFGGLNNETIFSSLNVLDTNTLTWEELVVQGERPRARHSHSMVAYESKLFMFGGYSGEKALGDLYSFDIQTCLWKAEKVGGRSPHARFSHSMFVYKNYIGIIGGCPVRQHCQELALLDMRNLVWKHVTLYSMDKEMFVRCTANVVHDDLIMVGGGAACYAFGTRFSEPMKINLLPLLSLDDHDSSPKIGENQVNKQEEGMMGNGNACIQAPHVGIVSTQSPEPQSLKAGNQTGASSWVVQLERKYAKLGKDILKKFGWLDLERKVYAKEDGLLISFPVTEKFCAIFLQDKSEGLNDHHPSKPFRAESCLLNEVSSSAALDILKEYGATKLPDEVVEARKASKSPLNIMTEAVASLLRQKGLSVKLLEQLPNRWERLGDIVVLPVSSFKDPVWDSIGDELWPIIARSLNTCRLARQGRVAANGTRDSTLEILVGDGGWVAHCENGILYSFDATKCMFSWGNLSEKIRMANLDCTGSVIVDLFAGIGYFVLPFLVRAKAKMVYACEWNPLAIEALKQNLQANSVSDHCIILEGDNRVTAPKGIADRVCLGLLPSSEGSWLTAVRALRSEGGILHVHGNVKDTEEELWTNHVSKSIYEIARSEGHCWEVTIDHVERVKWYAPHIRHLVADVRCRQIQG
ncbi:tRNA wybutosine-synthesizing protein 2/3/4 [Durio zibethinus]|uniref:tRNA wybutosine-synthesizing protein 2/3/4 n=1 Tax=Durio zibethinus TaxID=66656 RepID=A0A6P5X626_DURZI|nr:tRNA wybutosine-synthesizing protein 2/3/4 [Durio zibethinus]